MQNSIKTVRHGTDADGRPSYAWAACEIDAQLQHRQYGPDCGLDTEERCLHDNARVVIQVHALSCMQP